MAQRRLGENGPKRGFKPPMRTFEQRSRDLQSAHSLPSATQAKESRLPPSKKLPSKLTPAKPPKRQTGMAIKSFLRKIPECDALAIPHAMDG